MRKIEMLTRDEAFALVKKHVTKRNSLFHMVAVEAIMKSMAKYLGEDENLWALTGLLHDIDYEMTENNPKVHSSEKILSDFDVPEEVVRAIKSHNFVYSHVKPESKLEKALIACDAISGLLVACALVMPSKKLAEVKVNSVRKKFKDKSFARGVDRERILFCEEIGITKNLFFKLSLDGIRSVSSEIGV
jgi:putative nucleotidyltransferase with HDIG domain